jgi:Tfp pilus assembly protein PilN
MAISRDLRKLMAFGTGVGIEVGATDLEVVAARVRPSGVHVPGRLVLQNYANRPAAEWGAEYGHFLKSLGMSHVSATVLLPRRDVIVRQVALPGVASKELENAIRFQVDTLHPYGDDAVSWGWSQVASGSALVGIVRQETVDRYVQLFEEAGVAVCSFTFSAAAVHAAIRLNGHAASDGFVALSRTSSGAVSVYGESPSRPVFSAEFDLPPARATVLALSELRLEPGTEPRKLEDVLPKPAANPVENDLARNAMPYATALAGACPRLAPAANVLPPEFRKSSSRMLYVPSIVLAAALVILVAGVVFYSKWAENHYLDSVDAEIAKLAPSQTRADGLQKAYDDALVRTKQLDQIRIRTRQDLDALNELTRLLEPPTWTRSIEITRDTIRITGESQQSTSLVKILDSSPQFKNTTLENTGNQTFTIRMTRQVPQ